MMKKRLLIKVFISVSIFSLVLFLGLLLLGEQSAASSHGENSKNSSKELKVTYNLSGELQTLEGKELVVMFSSDMKALGAKRQGWKIVSMMPVIRGQFLWRGNKTLVFKPTGGFPYSMRFRVTIPKGTRARDGSALRKNVSWEFSTPAPRPVSIRRGVYRQHPRKPFIVYRKITGTGVYDGAELRDVYHKEPLVLTFNQPVWAKTVKKFFFINHAKSGKASAFTCKQKSANQVAVTFTQPLERGARYKAVLAKGIRGVGGNTGSKWDFTFYLNTAPAFTYTGETSRQIRNDQTHIGFRFSNPLRSINPDRVSITRHTAKGKHEITSFSIYRTASGHNYNTGNINLEIFEPLETGDRLTIKLKKSIANLFGESLEPRQIDFKVCGGFPVIDIETGTGNGAGKDADQFGLRLQNVETVQLEAFKLNRAFFHDLRNSFNANTPLFKEDLPKERVDKSKIVSIAPPAPLNISGYFPVNPQKTFGGTGFFGFRYRGATWRDNCGDKAVAEYIGDFDKRAKEYLFITHRRNHDFILNISAGSAAVWAYRMPGPDRVHFRPLAGAPVAITRGDGPGPAKTIRAGKTSPNGMLFIDFPVEKGDAVTVTDPVSNEIAFLLVDSYSLPPVHKDIHMAKIATDRILYLPGETIHIFGALRKRNRFGKLLPLGSSSHKLIISRDRDNKTILEEDIETDGYGAFSYTFHTAGDTPKGKYTVKIAPEDPVKNQYGYYQTEGRHSFKLDHYQPNTFTVAIRNMGGALFVKGGGKNPAPIIAGSFFSGNPMSGESLNYTLSVSPGISYRLLEERKLEKYDFGLAREFTGKLLRIEKEAVLDRRGQHRLALSGLELLRYPAQIGLEATAVSKEGKEITSSDEASWFPGRRVTGIAAPYLCVKGKPCTLDLLTVDARIKPASATVDAVIMFIRSHTSKERIQGKRKMDTIKTFKNIRIKGNHKLSFTPPRTGDYLIKVETRDPQDNKTVTSAEFKAVPVKDDDKDFHCTREKESFNVGETVTLKVHSRETCKALVTVGKGKLLSARMVEVKGGPGGTPVRFKVLPSYFPRITVNVAAAYPDGTRMTRFFNLTILSPARRLHVSLTPAARVISPSSTGTVDIRVRGYDEKGQANKKGKKARVFVYAVNEGSLEMTGYRVPDMYRRFYGGKEWQLEPHYAEFFSKSQRVLQIGPGPLYHWQGAHSLVYNPGGIHWMRPGRPFRGSVTGPDGKPLARVRVMMILHRGTGQKKPVVRSMFTDPRGRFDFGPVSGTVYRACFAKEGYKPYWDKTYWDRPDVLNVSLVPLETPGSKTSGLKTETGPKHAKYISSGRKIPYRSGGPMLKGSVAFEDGSPLPGVTLTLEHEITGRNAVTVSNEKGRFYFPDLPSGVYSLRSWLQGFNTVTRKNIYIGNFDVNLDIMMMLSSVKEEIVVTGKLPPTPVTRTASLAPLDEDDQSYFLDQINFSKMLRKDFREVLFFKAVETDKNGFARVSFKSSDSLSTYRIMAVACTHESFGNAETHIRVTKPVLLEEAVPEFARCGDRFIAGFRIGNRTPNSLTVSVNNKPAKDILTITGKNAKTVTVPAKGNTWVWFDFEAPKPGEEELRFYASAHGKGFKDALLKKIPVFPRWATESLLDFDAGEHLKKAVKPQAGAAEQSIEAEVSPTMLTPASRIRDRLSAYPYGCLEQQTSKIIPWIMLDQEFLDRTASHAGLKIPGEKVKTMIEEYIKIIPRYKIPGGGLSYFPGSGRTSHYLTVYVLWGLRMAREKFPELNTDLEKELREYMDKEKTGPVDLCFYQFVKSIDKQADAPVLANQFQNRRKLPIMARVFLYRAIHRQGGPKAKEMTDAMTAEFRNGLVVEADFAYFHAREFAYNEQYPFYSSRFVTALIFQAILEVRGQFIPAPRVIRWLLETKPYNWFSTQTNFWILYASNYYYNIFEKDQTAEAALTILGETHKKTFTANDTEPLNVKKSLGDRREEFTLTLKAARPLYLTTQLNSKIIDPPAKNRGIHVERRVYDESGKRATSFEKGKKYMVELLITPDKEIPYGVIDEPLAAGFEVIRQDMATSKPLEEFNKENKEIQTPWLWTDHAADRIVFYSYFLHGKIRVVYFVKAMYRGTFTWLPAVVQGMYHPQYFGRNGTVKVRVGP